MAQSKSDQFSDDLRDLARWAHALGHPARLAIIGVLAEKNACICGEIVDVLPLAQSTVSQHLKELKNAGLITGEVEGTAVCYCLDVANWNRARAAFTDLFRIACRGRDSDCC